MLRPLSLITLSLWACTSSAAPDISFYQASCDGCGEQRVEMGSHTFCALSYVHSGGFNSACAIGGSPKAWRLVATDPDKGETQACAAICMDLETSAGGGDPVAASPRQVAAPKPAVAPAAGDFAPKVFGPYQTDFGTLSMRRDGSRVTGTYTHMDGRLDGALNGYTLTGRWTQSNGEGRLVFRFNQDYSAFTGVWSYGDANPEQQWNGSR